MQYYSNTMLYSFRTIILKIMPAQCGTLQKWRDLLCSHSMGVVSDVGSICVHMLKCPDLIHHIELGNLTSKKWNLNRTFVLKQLQYFFFFFFFEKKKSYLNFSWP